MDMKSIVWSLPERVVVGKNVLVPSCFWDMQAAHKPGTVSKANDVESSSDENSGPEEDVHVRLGGTRLKQRKLLDIMSIGCLRSLLGIE